MLKNKPIDQQSLIPEYRQNAKKYWDESNEFITECDKHFESSAFIEALKHQYASLELAIAELNKIPDQDKNDEDYRNLMAYHNNFAQAHEMVCVEDGQMCAEELIYATKYLGCIKNRTAEDFSDVKDMLYSAQCSIDSNDPKYLMLSDAVNVLSSSCPTSIECFERLSFREPLFYKFLLELINDENFPNKVLQSYPVDYMAFESKDNTNPKQYLYTNSVSSHLTFDYGHKNPIFSNEVSCTVPFLDSQNRGSRSTPQ